VVENPGVQLATDGRRLGGVSTEVADVFQDYSRLGHAHARGLHTPAGVVGVADVVKVARHLADALPLMRGPLLLLPI